MLTILAATPEFDWNLIETKEADITPETCAPTGMMEKAMLLKLLNEMKLHHSLLGTRRDHSSDKSLLTYK
jgi:hypothetical protein